MFKRVSAVLVPALVATTVVVTGTVASAATLVVDPHNEACDNTAGAPYCSIQAAVEAAAASDVIVLASGVHTGTGNYVVDNTGFERDLTIRGAADGTTVISGEEERGGMVLGGDATITLEDVTIQDGSVNYSDTDLGGGMRVERAAHVIANRVSVVDNYTLHGGGGIHVSADSGLTWTVGELAHNESTFGPGGLAVWDGEVKLVNLHIHHNQAGAGPAPMFVDGGAIGVYGDYPYVTVESSLIESNEAARGGGIFFEPDDGDAWFEMRNTTVRDNTAHATGWGTSGGGGVYVHGGEAKIKDSVIYGNTAVSEGGGILHVSASPLEVVNTTLSGNSAGRHGGGAYSAGHFRNVTIAHNAAQMTGPGLSGNAAGQATIANTLITANEGNHQTVGQCSMVESLGHNAEGAYPSTCGVEGDTTGVYGGPIAIEPLADNGGPTLTHALPRGSWAILEGNPAALGSGATACPTHDQRGLPRTAGRCDIGAFQTQWGKISGSVTTSEEGTSAGGELVEVYTPDGEWVTSRTIGFNGAFTTDFLLAGDYLVTFAADSDTFKQQWFNGVAAKKDAKLVTVAPGATATGINAVLVPLVSTPAPDTRPGAISGIVTRASTGKPMAGVNVVTVDHNGDEARVGVTKADGTYTISHLKPGTYTVSFGDSDPLVVRQWWNGKTSAKSATTVTVKPNQTTSGINASLKEKAPFKDVPDGHPFAHEIAFLAQWEVTGGYSDGTFRPSDRVSRQAMAAFLYRFSGGTGPLEAKKTSFKDVSKTHPFYEEVTWLANRGITGGYPDGTFRPQDGVSRQAMAAFLYRYAGMQSFDAPSKPTFPDVPKSHPFFVEVEWLASTGITGGYPDGTFRPTDGVSRQAMAAFLVRFSRVEEPH